MRLPSIEQFESARIQPDEFDHEAHVYIAWRYLQRYELLESIRRYRAGLRNIVRVFGAESKYHETITWFYMISIAEHMEGDSGQDWVVFRRENPELFARNPGWIDRHYTPACLASSKAKTRFVLPDV